VRRRARHRIRSNSATKSISAAARNDSFELI
jgi:hypothetical protein